MKRLIILAMLLPAFCCVSLGQNLRTVKGRVVDINGTPVPGVKVTALDSEGACESDDKGNFALQVPYSCREVNAEKKDYFPAKAEIDGSFLILKLKYDTEGVRRREEAARIVEEAKRKMAAEAEAKAVRDSLAAVERARKEAEALAREKKKAEVAELDSKYDERFKNKGLAHSVDVSYMFEAISQHPIIYRYSGEREYGALHLLQLTYTLSWKFNRLVSLGVGAGVLFNSKSITIVNDEFYGAAADFKERRVDVPVFLNLRTNFCRTAVRPYISLTGGFYCLSKTLLVEAGLGCEYRFSKAGAVRIQASANMVPWPEWNDETIRYKSLCAPGVKLGFDF